MPQPTSPAIPVPVEFDDEDEAAYRYVDQVLTDVLAILDRWHDAHHGTGRRHHCHEPLCRDVTTLINAA